MSTQVTLTLPDALWERAGVLARRTGRDVTDLLAETIELSLNPLGACAAERPVENWADQDLLAAVDAQLSPADDQRLSELLDRQQAGALAAAEQAELRALMQAYQDGLLRKAQTLREAVRRGLRERPAP